MPRSETYRRGVPREVETIECRHCGALIRIYRETDAGRHLIVNVEPVEGGTVIASPDGRTASVVPPGRGPGLTLHTCRRSS